MSKPLTLKTILVGSHHRCAAKFASLSDYAAQPNLSTEALSLAMEISTNKRREAALGHTLNPVLPVIVEKKIVVPAFTGSMKLGDLSARMATRLIQKGLRRLDSESTRKMLIDACFANRGAPSFPKQLDCVELFRCRACPASDSGIFKAFRQNFNVRNLHI